ncbi:hypothetical protein, partial [Acidiferrobacter thiooxydans]
DRAGERLQQRQQLPVIGLLVIIAIAPLAAARGVQVGRVAVDNPSFAIRPGTRPFSPMIRGLA